MILYEQDSLGISTGPGRFRIMSEYRIISDSSCDLPEELAAKENITVVPFYVSFQENEYLREGVDISVRDFYEQMVRDKTVFPKSSLPAIQDYAAVFEELASQGIGIVCICITAKFSGSVQSALNAKQIVLESYPDARIEIIDSQVDTVLQGMYVLEAAKMCRAGVSMEACVQELLSMRDSARIFFTIGSIDYLKHGGRIGKLSGLAASVLGIKPLITLKEGEIFNSGIARSRKSSITRTIELLKHYMQENSLSFSDYRICVGFGYDYEEACEFRTRLLSELEGGPTEEECPIFQIGATIAVHTGPYPIGIGILKKQTLVK